MFESYDAAKSRMEQRCAGEAAECDDEMLDAGWEACLTGWYAANAGGIVLQRGGTWRAALAWERRRGERDEEEAVFMPDAESESETRSKEQVRQHLKENSEESSDDEDWSLKEREENMLLHDEYKARFCEQCETQLRTWTLVQPQQQQMQHRRRQLVNGAA